MKAIVFALLLCFTAIAWAGTPTGAEADLKVIQVTDQGILATGYIEQPDGTSQKIQDVIFIYCKPGQIADGDSINQKIYPAGLKKYLSVTGAEKTVHAYALSAEVVAQIGKH